MFFGGRMWWIITNSLVKRVTQDFSSLQIIKIHESCMFGGQPGGRVNIETCSYFQVSSLYLFVVAVAQVTLLTLFTHIKTMCELGFKRNKYTKQNYISNNLFTLTGQFPLCIWRVSKQHQYSLFCPVSPCFPLVFSVFSLILNLVFSLAINIYKAW